MSLSHNGAAGPRPITQSELATALALASTPDSSAVTPTTASQVKMTDRSNVTFYRGSCQFKAAKPDCTVLQRELSLLCFFIFLPLSFCLLFRRTPQLA